MCTNDISGPQPVLEHGPRLLPGLLAVFAGACAFAGTPIEVPGWVLTQNAAYAIHLQDRLAWPRCVEGMQWVNNTCTGKPVLATYAQAISLAEARKKVDGVNWRLPTVVELQRLVNKSSNPPGLDTKLFPGTPLDWYWSGTANVTTRQVNPYDYGNIVQGRTSANANASAPFKGWVVNLMNGEVRGEVSKRSRMLVRLVATQN